MQYSYLFSVRVSKPSGSRAAWLPWLLLLPLTLVRAQSLPYQMISLTDKRSYSELPANWSFSEHVSIHPYKENQTFVKPGQKVLAGKPGAALSTAFQARNLRLFVEFLLTPGASGHVILPGGVSIPVSDHKALAPSSQTSGYIVQTPEQNAIKLPGLLQTLELDYEADLPGQPGTGRLNRLVLNGAIVQQNVYIPLGKNAGTAQPVSFQTTKGTIVLRTIGYQVLETRKPVQLENLSYKIYLDAWDSRQTNRLEKSGTSPVLTQEVAAGKKEFNLVYEGDLVVGEAANYLFTTIYNGAYCQLSIDGTIVSDTRESSSQESHTGRIRLDKGRHRLKLWYSRFPWSAPALGLTVESESVRAYPLHVLSSLPQPPPKPWITVSPGQDKAEMIRSFVLYQNEKNKRTHCLSVGSPSGHHYTIDLNRGALLQVWKGNFANTTEMWYDRGEPQLLYPSGVTVPVSGQSSLARLPDPQASWPDSSAIRFLGYRTDQQGFPIIRYQTGAAVIADLTVSGPSGLTRTLTPETAPGHNLYILAGAGQKITNVETGLYNVDDRYYVRINGKTAPIVRVSGSRREILLPLNAPVTYTLSW